MEPFGPTCVMTDPGHLSGTDRIAEIARKLDDEIVVNVQGDEPEIEPETVDGLIGLIERTKSNMATAATNFPAGADVADSNLVKVVFDQAGRAMYFSRSPIPFHRDPTDAHRPTYYLHLGIYAYAMPFLMRLASLKPTPGPRVRPRTKEVARTR